MYQGLLTYFNYHGDTFPGIPVNQSNVWGPSEKVWGQTTIFSCENLSLSATKKDWDNCDCLATSFSSFLVSLLRTLARKMEI